MLTFQRFSKRYNSKGEKWLKGKLDIANKFPLNFNWIWDLVIAFSKVSIIKRKFRPHSFLK